MDREDDREYDREAGRQRSPEFIRERALHALRQGDFTLAERLLEQGDVSLAELVENLRIYQVELELQNIELRHAQLENQRASQRFGELFAAIPLPVLVVDRAGLILDANHRAQDLFGLENRHLRQHFLRRLVSQADHPALARAIVQALEHGQSHLASLAFQVFGQIEIQGDLHIAHLADMPDLGQRFVCVLVDQTEHLRHQAELSTLMAQLADQETRYRVLADYSPDWEYWLGPDGRYVYVSPACEDISGHVAAEFLDDPDLMERILHPDDQAVWRDHAHKRGEYAEGHEDIKLRILRGDGSVRWIEHHCRAILDAQGQYLGLRGVNRDITGRRLAEEEVRRLNRLFNTLSRCNQAMASQDSEAAMLHQICRTVVESGGLEACIISLLGDADAELVHVAQAGLDDALLAAMPIPRLEDAHRYRSSAIDPDPEALPDIWSVWAGRAGVRAAYQRVVSGPDGPLGLITYLSSQPDALTGDFTALLRELADDLGRALSGFRQRRGQLDNAHRLARRQAQLDALMALSPLGMGWMIGESLVEANAAFGDLLGYAAADIPGLTTLMLYSDATEYDRVAHEMDQALATRECVETQTVLRRRSGEEVRVRLSLAALDRADPSMGVVFVVTPLG